MNKNYKPKIAFIDVFILFSACSGASGSSSRHVCTQCDGTPGHNAIAYWSAKCEGESS